VSPQLDAFGLVVSDMARSVAFYRLLGLHFPDGAENEGQVEAQLGGGIRLMLDTEDVVRSFDSEWERGDHVHGGACRCESPEEVDRMYVELLEAGGPSTRSPSTPSGANATRRSGIPTAPSSTSTPRRAERKLRFQDSW
jgi:predicted lactoylglutathione lyase